MFPAETLPDGSTLLLHHYTLGVVAALFGVAAVWDNYARVEPLAVGACLVVGLLGFVFGWNTAPVVGATAALIGAVGPVVIILADLGLGASFPWNRYPVTWGAWVVIWSLVALDDAVSHAFGVWTPLDAFFHAFIWGAIRP